MRVGVEGTGGINGVGVGDGVTAGLGVIVGSCVGEGERVGVGVSVGPGVGVGAGAGVGVRVAVAVVVGGGDAVGAGWAGFTVMQATVQRVTTSSTPASRNTVGTPLRMELSYVVTQQLSPTLNPQGGTEAHYRIRGAET